MAPPLTGNPYGDHESREGLLVVFGGNNTSGPIDVAACLNAKGGLDAWTLKAKLWSSIRCAQKDSMHQRTVREEEYRSFPVYPTIETLSVTPILEAGARTGVSTDDPRAGICIGEPGDPMYTLQSGKQHAIAFSCKDHGSDAGDVTPTLRSMEFDGSHANGGGQIAVAFNLRGREDGAQAEISDVASIRAASGGSSRSYVASVGVRRLTPKEAERLQGFPDNFTLVDYRGKPAADGQRYRALGNSIAIPCLSWIGRRIQQSLEDAAPGKPEFS